MDCMGFNCTYIRTELTNKLNNKALISLGIQSYLFNWSKQNVSVCDLPT